METAYKPYSILKSLETVRISIEAGKYLDAEFACQVLLAEIQDFKAVDF